jgi:hypothetical protein
MRTAGIIIAGILLLLATGSLATPAWATGGTRSFSNIFAGQSAFQATSIQQTTDGGFIVAGDNSSSGFPSQVWLLRLNPKGEIVWQKAYGTPGLTSLPFLTGPKAKPTPDGGFAVVSSKDLSPATIAAWVFKVDKNGNFVWQKAFTGMGNATGLSIDVAPDGGLLVAGSVIGIHGIPSAGLVISLDPKGNVIWQKAYTGFGAAEALSIRETQDGGSLLAGFVDYPNEAWLLKLDATGGIVWQQTYSSGTSDNSFISAQQTSDGGFVAAGITINHLLPVSTAASALVVKLDRTGSIIWQKIYIGTGIFSVATSIQQTSDGGYVLTGYTGVLTGSTGPSFNALIMRLDSLGNIVWQKSFSVSSEFKSTAIAVQQTSDGGFAVAGDTGPAVQGVFTQAVVMKLTAKGEIHHCGDLKASNLLAAQASVTAASVTGSAIDIATAPIITTFVAQPTSASETAVCR